MSDIRYVCLPLGLLDRVDQAGCRAHLHTYISLWTHPAKRTIPGLLMMGPAGLSESLGESIRRVRAALSALERRGLVVCDHGRRAAIYVAGACAVDPPSTPQTIVAFSRQLGELDVTSVVRAAVCRDVEANINREPPRNASGEKQARPSMYSLWLTTMASARSEVGTVPVTYAASIEGTSESAPHDRTPAPETVAAFRLAWSRLPMPPFPRAAARDVDEATARFTREEFDRIVVELACSFVVLKPPGSRRGDRFGLRRLLSAPDKLRSLLDGEYRELATEDWRCPSCRAAHRPSDICPAPCPGCGMHHDASQYCIKLRRKLASDKELEEYRERVN